VKDLKDICYVVFDAHFDLRDRFDGSELNHACTVRRVYDKLENGEITGLFQVGVRSGTLEERRFAEKSGIKFYYSWEVYDSGLRNVLKELESYDRIYLSLDMDAFDPSFAPGVSTPEPFGIHPFHFLEFISEVSDRLVGFDIVEVVPDINKVTQSLSAKLIAELIASLSR
jgi:agmatinase